jgi:hypothetical protein
MNLKSFFLLTCLFTHHALAASNHLLYIGAGGEPDCRAQDLTGPHAKSKCENTMFDTGLKVFSNNLLNSNWSYQVSFNGGHKETEKILREGYQNPVLPTTNFTAANYKKMIKDYEDQVKSGKIKNGDQLLIVIAAHGAYKQHWETSHSIVASGGSSLANKNDLSKTSLVQLDDLKKLIALTNSRGIKLGIVDLSCRSGNTLELAKNSPYTCVIAATGPTHYAYMGGLGTFSTNFLNSLKSGQSLEGVFLKARSESTDPSFPMISTEENESIVSDVYAEISPYLFYKNNIADSITDYVINNSRDELMCKREEQFRDLAAKIEQLTKATKGKSNFYRGAELKKLLAEYKSNQDQILNALKEKNYPALDQLEVFETSVTFSDDTPAETFIHKFTWKQILESNPKDTIEKFKKFAEEADTPSEKRRYLANVGLYQMIEKKRVALIKKYPDLGKVRSTALALTAQMTKSYKIAVKITQEERKFYTELYRQKRSNKLTSPCRKFVF